MKKFKVYLIASFCMLVGLILTACGNVKVKFNENEITMSVGQELEPSAFLMLEGVEVKDVDFQSSNIDVVYITPQNTFVARGVGSCVIYANASGSYSQISVNVKGNPVNLSTPLGLMYSNGRLSWQEVIESVDDKLYVCDSYEIELIKDDETIVISNIVTNYYDINASGVYKARVRAVGNSNFIPSEFSEQIEFSAIFAVTNLNYDENTSSLVWTDDKNSSGTIYKIIKNGVYLDNKITKNDNVNYSFNINVAGGEPVSLQVVSVIAEKYEAKSDVLKLTKLNAITIQVLNGEITWNEVAGASEYSVFVENISTGVVDNILVDSTSYSVSGKSAGQYKVYVKAVSSSQDILQSDKSNELTVTKLPQANLSYNKTDKTFTVGNTSTYSPVIVIKNSSGEVQNLENGTYTFDKQDLDMYSICAYFKATTNEEINGDFSKTYNISQLGTATLNHFENENSNVITFDSILNANTYKVYVKQNDGQYTELATFEAGQNLSETFVIGQNLFSQAGYHTIKVEVINNGDDYSIYLSSEMTLEVERLENVQNVIVEDNLVSWDAVQNAEGYEYFFNVYGTDEIVGGVQKTTATSIAIPQTLSFGKYSLNVKALGNNENVLSSVDYSQSPQITIIEQLPSPELTFDKENNLLTLIPKDSIQGTTYKLEFYNPQGSLIFSETSLQNDRFEKNIQEFLTSAGVYRATAQAINVNPLVEYSPIYEIHIEKLEAPNYIKVANNVVGIGDSLNGIEGVLTTDPILVFVNGEKTSVLLNEEDEFNIEVCYQSAQFSIVEGIKTYFVNSDYSEFKVNRLSVPSNIKYDFINKKIVWDSVYGADAYGVYINGSLQSKVDTNEYVYETSNAFKFKIMSFANDNEKLGKASLGNVGYVSSRFSEDIVVEKANSVTGLKLDITEETICLSWNESEESGLIYLIYVDEDLVGQTDQNEFVLTSSFSEAKTYEISVISTSLNLLNSEKSSVQLQKLASPTQLTKQLMYDKYSLTLIEGAQSFSVDGVVLTELDLTNLTMNDGEVQKRVKFNAISSESIIDGHYYLSSEESVFTFKRLATPTNLTYKNGIVGFDEVINSTYIIEIEDDNGITTRTSETNSIDLSELTNEFTFKVKAVSKFGNLQANTDEITYLDSEFSDSYSVIKENSVSNLKLVKTLDGLKIEFKWNSKEQNTPNTPTFKIQIDGKYADGVISNDGNVYSFEFEEKFNEIKIYTISVQVVGENFLSSNEESIYVERINAPQSVCVIEGVVTVNNVPQNKIANILINGELQNSINLNTLSENSNQKISVQYIAPNFEDITDGHYYLDSFETVFMTYKLFTPTDLKVENGNLVWKQDAKASSYTVKVTNSTGEELIIENLTQPNLALSDEQLLNFVNEIGNYNVQVRYITDDIANLTAYVEEENSPIANISSNYSDVFVLTKLSDVGVLNVSTNDLDPEQKEVTVSWSAVEGASNYSVYVNDILINTITDNTIVLKSEVASSGNYTVSVRANANDKISSEMSYVSFKRLAKVNYASVDANANVTWEKLENYSYYLIMYIDSTSEIFYENVVETNNIDFSANENLLNFAGGYVYFKVLVKGDGTTTLSGDYYEFSALKLSAPKLVVKASMLTMEEQGIALQGSYSFSLTIEHNGKYALDNYGAEINNIVFNNGQSFSYPNSWDSGDYTFKARAVSNTINVISSNVSSVTKTRLETISNHKFIRETLSDEVKTTYHSDSAVEYLSDKIYIDFDASENATNYQLNIGGYTTTLQLSNSRIDIDNEIDARLNGKFTIYVTSLATDDSNFINSARYEITGTRLSALSYDDFKTNNGKVSWVDNQNGVSYYLIKISEDQNEPWGYWQSADSNVNSASLNGINEGTKSYNIKALGNITVDGVSENVVLDSQYLTQTKQFTKLAKPFVTVKNGFITLANRIEGASSYYAVIGENRYILGDYSSLTPDQNDFVGYNNDLANALQSNTLYSLQVQACGGNSEIYSDYSDAINVKFLSNANVDTNSIKLMLDPSGDLTKTKLVFNIDINGKGAIIRYQNTFVLYNFVPTSTTFYLDRENLTIYANQNISIASMGSSEIESGGFYYLNSDFSYSKTISKLNEPTNVRIEDGIIKWNGVSEASGYYVYVNGSKLYTNNIYEIYTKNSLDLSEFGYGSLEDNKIYSIGVVAVCQTTDYISSMWNGGANDVSEETSYYIENVVLPHAPLQIDIIDGSLVWNSGLSGLNGRDINLLTLATYLNQLLNEPILLLYNSGSLTDMKLNFGLPTIDLQFTNINSGEVYHTTLNSNIGFNATGQIEINFEYLDLINVSEEQVNKLKELKNVLIDNSIMAEDSIEIIILDKMIEIFEERLSLQEIGLPNINKFIEEIKENNNIPAGKYNLQIRQIGDTVFLNSNYNQAKEIYIPQAPSNITIEAPTTIESERQFYLSWDNVTIDSTVGYTVEQKYLVIVEDIYGARRVVARVNEDVSSENNRTRINLTDLVNDDLLTPDDIKIFVVVAGDSNKTIYGRMSDVLNITVLPQVESYMDKGYLSWKTIPSAYGVQIIAVGDTQTLSTTVKLSDYTRWAGDDLIANISYSTSIRAVGEVYVSTNNDGVKTYVISGKKTEFTLNKLSAPSVSVNTKGIFIWLEVVGNVSGYLIDVNGQEISLTPTTTQYESTFAGYNRYQFRAQGDTCDIQEFNTYYLSSLPNKQDGKSYYGIYGFMLPEVTEIQIEEGKLKWKKLESLNNINEIDDKENYKQNIIYKLIIGEKVIYVEQDSYLKDDYIIYDNFSDLESGTYNMSIQAFVYWKPIDSMGTLPNIVSTLENYSQGIKDYYALLGEKSSTQSGEISKAKSITSGLNVNNVIAVENGMLVWDFVTESLNNGGKKHLDYILTFALDENFTSGIITTNVSFDGNELYAKWWDEVLVEGVNYYVKINVNGKTEYLNSSFTPYADNSQSPIVYKVTSPLNFQNILYDGYNSITPKGDEINGNSIEIKLKKSVNVLSPTYNIGFEIRYRAIGSDDETPWNYYDFGKLNNMVSDDIVEYSLDISKLGGVNSFEYQIQMTLLDKDNQKYLKSNWSELDTFNTPTQVEEIYYDESTYEFYWKDEKIEDTETYYGYIILDELLNEDGSILESYKYIIPAGSHYSLDYIKSSNGTRYVYYAPFEIGNHRISVRKTADNQGALISAPTYYSENGEEFTVYNFDLFEVENLSGLNHGSAENPYLISDSEDFANIKARPTKYTYMTSYTDKNNISKTSDSTYTFRQNNDITITINNYFLSKFDNVYDGNEKTLNYTIINTSANATLFNNIGTNGVFKNTKINVTLQANSGSVNFASIAYQNNGLVYNCLINGLGITGNASSINIAGFVFENYGTVQGAILNVNLESNKISNASGIVNTNNGIITQCGNNGNITINGSNATRLAGIVLYNNNSVNECYNKGILTLSSNVGEVYAGGISAQNGANSSINNSYNTGIIQINGSHSILAIGGIVGNSSTNSIDNCYSTQVIISEISANQGAIIGKLNSASSGRNNYYLEGSSYAIGNIIDTSFAQSTSEGDMKDVEFYKKLNESSYVYDEDNRNNGYPILRWENNENLLINIPSSI